MYNTINMNNIDMHGLPLSDWQIENAMGRMDCLPWKGDALEFQFLCVWYDIEARALHVSDSYPCRESRGKVPCGVLQYRVEPQELADMVVESVERYARDGYLDYFEGINWAPMDLDDRADIDATVKFIRKAKGTEREATDYLRTLPPMEKTA